MHPQRRSFRLLTALLVLLASVLAGDWLFAQAPKHRILVISSYHREYLWSQDTHAGVCAAFRELGYLENEEQVEEYTQTDSVESTRAVVRKLWMDTKHKNRRSEIAQTVARILDETERFRPDLILLGDDNAANYIGNQFIDTELPVVFWGINGLPLKYGLLDSLERPGHNVTGVYQAGYLKEALEALKRLIPGIRNFAVLSDDSSTGRSKAKELQQLARRNAIPLQLVETVVTNSYAEWQAAALRLQQNVDAFFVLNHNTLKDEQGRPVEQLQAGAWYLRNIRKPEAAHEKQFAEEGLLLVVDDSGFKQGYDAVKLAHRILEEGADPAELAVRAPEQGPLIVNRLRARTLGIELAEPGRVEQWIDRSLALERHPQE